MSRKYECVFASNAGDMATTTGEGNTRKSAELWARRKLPKSEAGHVEWYLRSIRPIRGHR